MHAPRNATFRTNVYHSTMFIRRGSRTLAKPLSQTWIRTMGSQIRGPIHFGPFEVTSQVFLTTPHSFALVNLKPLLPGHVLICPLKPYRRLTDLSAAELTDLFQAVQRVQRMLARHFFPSQSQSRSASSPLAPPDAGSFNIAIQDGSEAGQTVPHLHVHVIPRIRGATEKDPATAGDQIYELMAAEEGNVGGALWDLVKARPKPGGQFPRIEDCDRVARSQEDMKKEAEMFRGVLREMDEEEGMS